MNIQLKADVGSKVKILNGNHKNLIGEILCIHGHGTVEGFLKLYEPAYEILTSDYVQARYNTEDFEPC